MVKPVSDWVERLVRSDVRSMKAYHVADASGLVKLDAMENPYPWPGELQQQWIASLSGLEANRYPDPSGACVLARLREVMNIDPALDIILGNGSDEIIQLLIQALAKEDALVMSPEPGFVMYRVLADINRVRYRGVPLTTHFQLDLAAMLDCIDREQPAIIFLAQPNNPTGNLWDIDSIEAVIQASKGLVVIDEAYMAFTDSNFLPFLKLYPNVLIMRTLSKVGLAGMRLGFLVGQPQWVEQINKIRLPYNINVLTQLSVDFALQHYDVLKTQTAEIRAQRQQMMSKLQSVGGLEVFPSEANFILVREKAGKGSELFQHIKSAGLLVKNLDGAHALLANCLRLTVGDEAQNRQLFSAISAFY